MRPFCDEFVGVGVAVVGEVKAGRHRAAEEGDLALAEEARALPDSGGDDELDVLSRLQIGSKSEKRGALSGIELEHFDGVAGIEVEDFVRGEDVHLRECARFEQVVDGGSGGANAAGELDGGGRGIGAAEGAAFNRVRLKREQGFDFVGGHRSRW